MPLYRDQIQPEVYDTAEEFEAAQHRAVPRPKGVCARCGHPMTWAEQRRQFGRLMRQGFAADAARQMLPRCQTCMTITLRADAP